MQTKKLLIATMILSATPAFSQQLTREIVDNMNRMCGTGQTVTGGLETDISLLKRLGVIGVENAKTEREIATIIDSIKDEKTKIDALRAIQSCNFEYLRMQGKRSDQQKECIKSVERERKQQQLIKADKSVRCEGGGPMGDADYKEDTASLAAPTGFIFSGAADVKINSESRGTVDAVVYSTRDGNNIGASARIWCKSPDHSFGPGAWIDITLSATIEKMLSPADLGNIQKSCSL